MLNDNIDVKLDEADLSAECSSERFAHEDVFS